MTSSPGLGLVTVTPATSLSAAWTVEPASKRNGTASSRAATRTNRTILAYIDNGYIALPEFQRGYVWNREQVRGLFDSLYRRHPVGGLLVWSTESKSAAHRGDSHLAPGIVKLLLDGQQRMTTLYGVVRGKPPAFFDGNAQAFSNLMFHIEREEFAFFQPIRMWDEPLWIDVTSLMQKGKEWMGLVNSLMDLACLLRSSVNASAD